MYLSPPLVNCDGTQWHANIMHSEGSHGLVQVQVVNKQIDLVVQLVPVLKKKGTGFCVLTGRVKNSTHQLVIFTVSPVKKEPIIKGGIK